MPTKEDSTKSKLKFGRYGARRASSAETKHAGQQQMLDDLPPPGRGMPRWLTLTEVQRLHEHYIKPMTPKPYGRKPKPTPIRDHAKSTMCRRQYYVKSSKRMASAKRHLEADKMKTVTVQFAEPEDDMRLANKSETFVIPVHGGRFRQAERHESGRVHRHRVAKAVTGPPATCQLPPPEYVMDRQVVRLEAGAEAEELPFVTEEILDMVHNDVVSIASTFVTSQQRNLTIWRQALRVWITN